MFFRVIAACLCLGLGGAFSTGCTQAKEPTRDWQASDHAHPPDTLVDPNRVPGRQRATISPAERLFEMQCARCHGSDGRGGSEAPVNFANSTWQKGATDKGIARIIAVGKPPMPGFGNLLNDDQIALLVERVRSFGAPNAAGATRSPEGNPQSAGQPNTP